MHVLTVYVKRPVLVMKEASLPQYPSLTRRWICSSSPWRIVDTPARSSSPSDPASSEFFDSGKYNLGYKDKSSEEFSPEQLAKLYNHLIDEYPIVLLEDPFAQDDWDSWSMFNTSCKIELVGDDLLATNAERIKLASDKKACNSLLLKINQIGTISEAISAYVVFQNLLADSPSPVMSVLTIIQCEYGIRPRLECFCLPSLRRDHGRLHRRLDGRATDRPSQVRKSMSR